MIGNIARFELRYQLKNPVFWVGVFLFFLLGPLFPVIVGGLAGSIGSQVSREAVTVEIGLAMNAKDSAAMIAASETLSNQLRGALPPLKAMPEASDPDFDPGTFLEERRGDYAVKMAGRHTPRRCGAACRGAWSTALAGWPELFFAP